MKENVLQSVRKLALIKDRVESLVACNRRDEALYKQAHHQHMTSSFAVILFLHEAKDLFNEGLGEAVSTQPFFIVNNSCGVGNA